MFANPACGQLNRKMNFPLHRSHLRIFFRVTGLAFPSHASILILYPKAEFATDSRAGLLHLATRAGVDFYHQPQSSGHSGLQQVTQVHADGVHRQGVSRLRAYSGDLADEMIYVPLFSRSVLVILLIPYRSGHVRCRQHRGHNSVCC